MPMVTLRDLYMAELRELADAEQQILAALPELIAAATSSRLRGALQDHLDQTRVHAERVELLLRRLGAEQEACRCESMRALVADGRRRIADTERGDVLDAALIGVTQRIEHHEIAAYGCARTYARTLGDGEAEQLLQQTLDEEGAADARLSRIAERGINQEAAEDAALEADRQRARLRYVPASAIGGFKYREFRVRTAQEDEDLGSLDGLIVEADSGRPAYFVIDSGGWFLGQRFLVPIDALRPHDDTQTLRTDLDRDAIRSYPPFTPDAYVRENAAGETVAPEPYQPPTWLMTGVWMTEASGFASVPPRAESDYRPAEHRQAPDRESELMRARGEDDREGDPRIERYRER